MRQADPGQGRDTRAGSARLLLTALLVGVFGCGAAPGSVAYEDPVPPATRASTGEAEPGAADPGQRASVDPPGSDASGPPAGAAHDPGAPAGATAEAAAIELRYFPCRAAVSTYRLSVHEDGRVDFDGERNTHVTGASSGRISPAVVQSLLERARQAGFASLQPHYACIPTATTRCSMHPCHASLRITLEGEAHQVTWSNEVAGPPSLHALVTEIERATDSAQWVAPGP